MEDEFEKLLQNARETLNELDLIIDGKSQDDELDREIDSYLSSYRGSEPEILDFDSDNSEKEK